MRYFDRQNVPRADALRSQVELLLAEHGVRIRLTSLVLSNPRYANTSEGQLEVWLPSFAEVDIRQSSPRKK